jgi:deoxyribose-phosphate aldolase
VETASLTRRELEQLVDVIAAEVVRQVRPSLTPGRSTSMPHDAGPSSTSAKEDACEGCPRNPAPPAAVSLAAIRLSPDVRALAGLMDHTLLRPEATRVQIEEVCDEALQMGFAAVCVNPAWVPVVAEKLRGSKVRVATVAGFPFGATSTAAKRAEAQAAILEGAQEVDMVMNIGAMRSGQLDRVEADIQGVAEVCRASGTLLKVIIENGYLSGQEKVSACQIAQRAGAEFVKTSTGFGPSGAAEADVRLMRQTVGPDMGVKAAGGIRTLHAALRMLQAGATRLGTSASLSILAEAAALAA